MNSEVHCDRYHCWKWRKLAAVSGEALHDSDQSSDNDNDYASDDDDLEVAGVACQTEETGNLVRGVIENHNSLRAEIVELKCYTDVVSPELLEGNSDNPSREHLDNGSKERC